MTYSHLQADCLYTGISSGPNGIDYRKPLPFYTSINYKHRDSAYLRQGTSVVAVCCGRWRTNDVIVAMAMPASACRALQRRAAQSVDTTFRISQ